MSTSTVYRDPGLSKEERRLVDDLIDIFDFETCRKIHSGLKWELGFIPEDLGGLGPVYRLPNVDDLKEIAISVLESLFVDDCSEAESGGFRAEMKDGCVRLSFVARTIEVDEKGNVIS